MPERMDEYPADNRRRKERGTKTKPQRGSLDQRLNTTVPVIKVGHMDYVILFSVLVLVSLGVIMVFSAGYYRTAMVATQGPFYYLWRQLAWAGIGFGVLLFMANFHYILLERFSFAAYIGANSLVALVPFIGEERGGARRWILIPYFGQFQPSELAKIAIIIMLAYMVYKNRDIMRGTLGFFVCCGMVIASAGLVLLGGLSNAIVVSLIGFGIIFVASPHIWRFVGLLGVGVAAVAGYIIFSPEQFRTARITAWLNPFESELGVGYQTIQSLYAIASGGLFGLGIGQSRQKSFLPEAHNDFVFAIICEELGLLGAGLVIFLFALIIWRGIAIAAKAPDVFGSLTATGTVLMLGGQAIINIAVVTNSIPNTGITLPFVSYGGTSLMVTMFLTGVLLNISRYSKN